MPPPPPNRARSKSIATQAKFEAIESALGPALFAKLEEEHQMEIEQLWQEQDELRDLLTQSTKLLREEVLPRERMMHEIIESFGHSFEASLNTFHQNTSGHISAMQEVHGKAKQAQQNLRDPMLQMEDELNRIAQLLSHGVVGPDIQGWHASPAVAAPARQQYQGYQQTQQQQQQRPYQSQQQQQQQPYLPQQSTFSSQQRSKSPQQSQQSAFPSTYKPPQQSAPQNFQSSSSGANAPSFSAGRTGATSSSTAPAPAPAFGAGRTGGAGQFQAGGTNGYQSGGGARSPQQSSGARFGQGGVGFSSQPPSAQKQPPTFGNFSPQQPKPSSPSPFGASAGFGGYGGGGGAANSSSGGGGAGGEPRGMRV